MRRPDDPAPADRAATGARRATSALLVASAALLILSAVLDLVIAGAGALAMVSGFAFAIVHGRLTIGGRNVAAFIVITVVVSFAAEATGVATGIVFGDYHYTSELGPRILGVPPIVQLAYVAMAYASMMTARAILGVRGPQRGWRIVAVAFAGAIPMVGWDVTMDPHLSTIEGAWIWEDGGEYFGVPLHNYVGWFLTVFVFLVLYGLWESRTAGGAAPRAASPWLWVEPALFYGIIAVGAVLSPLLAGIPDTLASPGNYAGSNRDMVLSLSLVGAFTMGGPLAFALLRTALDARPSAHARPSAAGT